MIGTRFFVMKLKLNFMIGVNLSPAKRRLPLGFSLIELIVSISIIALLSALFLANYRSTSRRTDLVMAAQTLVTDIRFAQANALGLIKYDDEVPAGGWGIYASAANVAANGNTGYTLFADENDDQIMNTGEAAANLGGKRIDLPPNIVIDRLTLGTSEVSAANITFLPPDPITRLRGSAGTSTVLEIRLREKVNDTTKTVRVNFLGLVEVID